MEKSIIRSTREGRLYIKTSDFFNQEKIIKIIKDLLESDIVKDIDKRRDALNNNK